MTFYAFGVNHLRAPVTIREAFALSEEGKRGLFRSIRLSSGGELIVLSTCNRTEAYLFGTDEDVQRVRNALCEASGRSWPEGSAFHLQDEQAVRHILEVAAGLRSLVLGDAQIFAQLKEAYRIAVEEQSVGTTMHRLMHTAFRAAKRVINETDLNTGAASIPYVAVDAASRVLSASSERSIETLRALVIGSGSMGRLAIEALKQKGISDITLSNRSEETGRSIAERSGAAFCPWSAVHRACVEQDLVIVATSADTPVIKADELRFAGVMNTLFIDISVPRNVEPEVASLGCTVIDVDALTECLSETESVRRTSVPAARDIVGDLLGEFVSWVFHHQALQPVIQTIADTFESIRVGEVERHHQRFSELDQRELDEITRSIVQKILAVPVVRLKSVEPESIDFVQGIRLLHALFRRERCEAHEPLNEATQTRSAGIDAPPREDCPIEPQLSSGSVADRISEFELDDVLRLYSMDQGRVSSDLGSVAIDQVRISKSSGRLEDAAPKDETGTP